MVKLKKPMDKFLKDNFENYSAPNLMKQERTVQLDLDDWETVLVTTKKYFAWVKDWSLDNVNVSDPLYQNGLKTEEEYRKWLKVQYISGYSIGGKLTVKPTPLEFRLERI